MEDAIARTPARDPPDAGRTRFNLDGLRGYAALLVYCTHAFGLLFATLYPAPGTEREWHLGDPDLARNALAFLYNSHYGVDLFFVLSGFLMADMALRHWPGGREFLVRRAWRIYPAYLASLAFVIAMRFTIGLPGFAAPDLIANLVLLQGWFPLALPPLNPVTWSLTFEMIFYLAVPLGAMAVARRGVPRAWPVLLAAAFAAIVVSLTSIDAKGVPQMAYFALFIPGIAIAGMAPFRRDRLAKAVPLGVAIAAWACLALGVKSGAIDNALPGYYLVSGLACGLVVLKLFDPANALSRAFASRPARWLGRHSYSFFLVHDSVVHLWHWALRRFMDPQSGSFAAVFLAGSLALSLLAARVLYGLVERRYFDFRRATADEALAAP